MNRPYPKISSIAEMPPYERDMLAHCIGMLIHEEPESTYEGVLGITHILNRVGLDMADLMRHIYDPATDTERHR